MIYEIPDIPIPLHVLWDHMAEHYGSEITEDCRSVYEEANRRYARMGRLQTFKREVERLAVSRLRRNRQDYLAYRRYCLENAEAYINGEIAPPTGRTPWTPEED